jgi:hypothetical protein
MKRNLHLFSEGHSFNKIKCTVFSLFFKYYLNLSNFYKIYCIYESAVILPVQRFSSGPYLFIFRFTIPMTDCRRMVFEPQHHVRSVFDRVGQVLGLSLSTTVRRDSYRLFRQTVVITTTYVTW